MGLAIYVPLPFLPFATEKSGMQTGRDSTGIKHEGKIKYLPFCFLFFFENNKKKGMRPRMLSFIQIPALIWGGAKPCVWLYKIHPVPGPAGAGG